MPFMSYLISVLRSGASITTVLTLGSTGGYVAYKDHSRFPRMMSAYRSGGILPPLEENKFQLPYFRRPNLEKTLKQCMSSTLSNDYHLVVGDIGSGKSRLVQEVIREMMTESSGEGAPIYVSMAQGKTFADTLAEAVHFAFDEHISFRFFCDYVLGIHSFPKKDEAHRLTRVLDAIEKSSCDYLKLTGKPVVLVIDGMDALVKYAPNTMRKLQEKAKLWADTNIVKIVFVSSNVCMMSELEDSGWSRAAPPVTVSDLTDEEAVSFLTSPGTSDTAAPMNAATAKSIVDLIGGRINYLRVFKRDHLCGVEAKVTASGLLRREKDKFLSASQNPSQWKVIEILRKSPRKTLRMSVLMAQTSAEDVASLLRSNILCIHSASQNLEVKFESRLAENLVDSFDAK
ncbi:hypothetical protein CAPTEDRAFT_193185 [Capitella teleta]|uniref:Orc1-like AAA ATPase domain-containing protein n=1 Tax=Capitella teleta TaxID=283909 RepID=R7UV41_CAPTE|nr:hypothetical protein CAPTEDRAFT_193185 [Capitella teleta]|eukprot:ELU07812.1 hypothetical protein CAPTEDRAFT_193185 [Capitella teleta]